MIAFFFFFAECQSWWCGDQCDAHKKKDHGICYDQLQSMSIFSMIIHSPTSARDFQVLSGMPAICSPVLPNILVCPSWYRLRSSVQLTLAYWLCSVLQGNGSRWEVSQRIMTIWMTHHDYSKLESTTCPFLLRNPKLIGGTMCICVSGLWGAHRSRSKYRVRNYRVEAVSQSSVRNQHPKVRISVAESASKPILDQHRG